MLTEQGTVPGLSEITDQLLNRLASTVQLDSYTIDAQKLLGRARDQFEVDAHIV